MRLRHGLHSPCSAAIMSAADYSGFPRIVVGIAEASATHVDAEHLHIAVEVGQVLEGWK